MNKNNKYFKYIRKIPIIKNKIKAGIFNKIPRL